MNILSIDDDKEFASWCETMLREAGVRIDNFDIRPKLVTGIEAASTGAPSLILLDLNLDDSRGAATIQGIPALDAIAPTIIVSGIVSHDMDPETLQLCYQAGAVGHIFKKHLRPTCGEMVAGMIVSAGYNWRRIHFSK